MIENWVDLHHVPINGKKQKKGFLKDEKSEIHNTSKQKTTNKEKDSKDLSLTSAKSTRMITNDVPYVTT